MVSNNKYPSVFVTAQLPSEFNHLLSESRKRFYRKKTQEATLRFEDHLKQVQSIPELDHIVPVDQKKD